MVWCYRELEHLVLMAPSRQDTDRSKMSLGLASIVEVHDTWVSSRASPVNSTADPGMKTLFLVDLINFRQIDAIKG
jgi:hypothetical protein